MKSKDIWLLGVGLLVATAAALWIVKNSTDDEEKPSKKAPQLVIEAIIEKSETKLSLFQQLEAINPIETIFASNTSSLSITKNCGRFVWKRKNDWVAFF